MLKTREDVLKEITGLTLEYLEKVERIRNQLLKEFEEIRKRDDREHINTLRESLHSKI